MTIISAEASAISLNLLTASSAARTEASRHALGVAAYLVADGKYGQACQFLAPLRTRAARAAIAALKSI
jgi:hypothetical protein